MLPPVYDWSGFYIGINGGWAQSQLLGERHATGTSSRKVAMI